VLVRNNNQPDICRTIVNTCIPSPLYCRCLYLITLCPRAHRETRRIRIVETHNDPRSGCKGFPRYALYGYPLPTGLEQPVTPVL
jgi:hypothetical protein